jgi:hypothetical protein
MSYTIYLKNYNVEKSQEEYYIEKSQEDILDFVSSIGVTEIEYISKSYKYKDIKNLCLYNNEFPDVDYIGNYTTLSEMYGPNAINNIDIQLVNYLQNK